MSEFEHLREHGCETAIKECTDFVSAILIFLPRFKTVYWRTKSTDTMKYFVHCFLKFVVILRRNPSLETKVTTLGERGK